MGTVRCKVVVIHDKQQVLTLNNVSYVPDTPFNLIGVSKLLECQQWSFQTCWPTMEAQRRFFTCCSS